MRRSRVHGGYTGFRAMRRQIHLDEDVSHNLVSEPKLLRPHVLDADHAFNETEPAHRLALLNPKLELATTGAEPGLHHGDLLLFGNHLRISGES